jgi:hypothetical protein
MSLRRATNALASLLLAASVCAGCSTTSSVGTPPSSTVAVPRGWKTYTYGKAKISVPGDWAVVTKWLCPGLSSTDTLYLGLPKGLAFCPAFVGPGDSIVVTALPIGTAEQSQCRIKMNGLRVYLGPCTSSNPIGVVFYDIPSLGIRAEGMGGIRQHVAAGSGPGTVVGQVLHTLRIR